MATSRQWLRLFLLLPVLLLTAGYARAQKSVECYIRSNQDPSYYLIPDDQRFYDATVSGDQCFTKTDNGLPFIHGSKDKSDAKWIVSEVKYEEKTYVQIRHKSSGRYITMRTKKNGVFGAYLASLDRVSDPTSTYFTLVNKSSNNRRTVAIVPYGVSDLSLNPKTNIDFTPNDNGQGYIQLYSWTSENSQWLLLEAPTINVSSDGLTHNITIEGKGENFEQSFRYTTDGSDPYGNNYIENDGTPLTFEQGYFIRAIATSKLGGITILSDVESYLIDLPKPTITCVGPGHVKFSSPLSGVSYRFTIDNTLPSTISSSASEIYCAVNVDYTLRVRTYLKYDNKEYISAEEAIYRIIPAPTITFADGQATLSHTGEGVTIYYTTDGTTPTTSSPIYEGGAFAVAEGTVINTMAKLGDYQSAVRSKKYVIPRTPVGITSLDEITDQAGNYYLTQDVNANGFTGLSLDVFTGTLDGKYHTVSNLQAPIFKTLDDAVVKNITFKDVDIHVDGGDAGVVASVAKGEARVYNCGVVGEKSEVSASEAAGSIVGRIDEYARVVNCYSYATITGGTAVGGIVGYNSIASTMTNPQTMVVNCMFYGDITGGTSRYPVYGGKLITNANDNGINNYNYYRDEASFGTLAGYNAALPAEEHHLTRYEYFRSVLNSNRELCAWWISGDYTNTDLVAKWVLDPEMGKYPVLKAWGRYASTVNRDWQRVWHKDADGNGHWVSRNEANEFEGKKLGTLKVIVKSGANGGGKTKELHLVITDMDTLDHDFGYYKVQLPYYNTTFGDPNADDWATRYAGNYNNYNVVTGWKVTAVVGGTKGKFVNTRGADNAFNFADRYCTDKDLYEVSGRVFAQGGYYYVPEGVTKIEIEAYWGRAIYLQNKGHSLDVVNLMDNKGGTSFTPTGMRSIMFHGQTVYDKMVEAVNQSGITGTVYDYAIVFVGNVQHYNKTSDDMIGNNTNHRYTLMSVDLDFDDEPDYCLQLEVGDGSLTANIAGIRMDFLTVADLGLAVKRHGSNLRYAISVLVLYGHFEVTETSMMTSTEFRYEDFYHKPTSGAPLIINGGQFPEEFVASNNNGTAQGTLYFIVGGNAHMKVLAQSSHNKHQNKISHAPMSVMGGEYEEVSLSGLLRNHGLNIVIADNPKLYTNGGRFRLIHGAGMEAVKGNVIFRIDHSIIDEFYGGGQHNENIISGNIDIKISNSRVGYFCGGPMVGNMADGSTITTHATNTIFGQYFGGGNGGTAYSLDGSQDDASQQRGNSASSWWMGNNEYVPLTEKSSGYQAKFKFQIWNMPSGTVAYHPSRRYLYNAQFATTTTHDVFNTLEGCHVLGNFYGAGNLGSVQGNVTSVLTDCQVDGSAYGAGFSANIPSFWVYTLNGITYPSRDASTGICHQAVVRDSVLYTWTNTEATTPIDDAERGKDALNYLNTSVSLNNLGAVTGNVSLTIGGDSKIGKMVDGILPEGVGNVFGGGNESAVLNGNTSVILQGNTEVMGNVYGGGNMGVVVGNSSVEIKE